MIRRYISFAIILIFICLNVSANVSFSVVPPATVVQGDKFQLTFTLQNGSTSNFKGPKLEGCKLLSDKGVSSFNMFQIVNGKTTSVKRIDYTCLYRAEKAGKVTVPPVSITVDGKQYKSNQITFTISENTGKPNQRVQSSILDEEYTTQAPGPIAGDEMFVRIILSKQQAYEQEPIECVIKLYTQYGIESFLPTTQPAFDGFIIEDISQQAILNKVETYNGKDYYTAVLKHCVIFPQKTGKLTINSGKYDVVAEKYEKVTFGGGYAYSRIPIREKLSISSNSASVNIIPLPSPRPDDYSGAVGQFEVETKLNSNSFRTNETATYEYIISGTGNIKYIKEPVMDFPVEFELYSPKSDFVTQIDSGQMKGKAIFEYTFVPQNVGKFQIPAHKFVYFDPQQNKYLTLTSEEYVLSVAKGVTTNVEQTDVVTKNVDIRHIKLNDKSENNGNAIVLTWWYWTIIILLIGGFVLYVYYDKQRATLRADVVGFKLAKANKVAQKRLKKSQSFMKDSKYKEFFEEINIALNGYISDKLAITTSQLTKENVYSQLLSHGVKENTCQNVLEILNECEMALYTPQIDNKTADAIYQKTISAINDIEAVKIKHSKK